MGPIEETLFEAESNRIQKPFSEEDKVSPHVQLFLYECKRIINILKDDDLLKKERERFGGIYHVVSNFES
jgi:hypothetical protein